MQVSAFQGQFRGSVYARYQTRHPHSPAGWRESRAFRQTQSPHPEWRCQTHIEGWEKGKSVRAILRYVTLARRQSVRKGRVNRPDSGTRFGGVPVRKALRGGINVALYLGGYNDMRPVMRIVLTTTLFFLAALPARAEPVTVFAAASLQEVLADVAARHRVAGGTVRLVFAATSILARQVARGAPADILVAAHPRWTRWLAAQPGVRLTGLATILTNRLALVAPRRADAPTSRSFEKIDLVAQLGGRRLAVGDPAHVPVGLYARAALRHFGLWARLRGRLAPASNTRAAVALVARGEAPLGIVYRSDAFAEKRLRIVALIPSAAHPPIRYQAAFVGAMPSAPARAFFRRLLDAARAGAFRKFGFDPWRGGTR